MNFKEFRSSLSESKKMKIKGVTIEVKKVGPKYRAIVDGDKLDDYKSEALAIKMAKEFLKQYKG
tara:strand:- start:6998 stop:7189 length:192 start_codon:yes stop_codon:yes gene_type:complete